MATKPIKKRIISVGIFILLLAGIYMGFVYYYSKYFTFGTWINGQYCTGKSVEEVQDEIAELHNSYQLALIDKNAEKFIVSGEDIGFRINVREQLNQIKKNQNPFLWPSMLLNKQSDNITLIGEYDENLLEKKLKELSFSKNTNQADSTAEAIIIHKENGYELKEQLEEVINEKALEDTVKEAVRTLKNRVSLQEEGCYETKVISFQSQVTGMQWDTINKMQNVIITYEFGDRKEILNNKNIHKWIIIKDNNDIVLDKEMIEEYVRKLAKKYDTIGSERLFHTYDQKDIMVSGGPYGWKINQKAEAEKLKELIENGISVIREPIYEKEARIRGENDIGNTYIEINLSKQVLYYMKDGELKFQTDIVSGNGKRGFDSPECIGYVYNKVRDVILRGEGYASFVNYWMKINGHIGIHDATWRSKFGGDIYKTNGSHGCINTPLKNMKELFNMMEVGTPVVMYYERE